MHYGFCLIYGYRSEPSVVAMGIIFYLFPLICIHLLITIIGHIVKNKVVNWICLIFSSVVSNNINLLFFELKLKLNFKDYTHYETMQELYPDNALRK